MCVCVCDSDCMWHRNNRKVWGVKGTFRMSNVGGYGAWLEKVVTGLRSRVWLETCGCGIQYKWVFKAGALSWLALSWPLTSQTRVLSKCWWNIFVSVLRINCNSSPKNYLYKLYIRSDVGHSLWHALIVWKKTKTKHHIFILLLPPSGSSSTLGSATLWESLPHSFRKTEKEHTP